MVLNLYLWDFCADGSVGFGSVLAGDGWFGVFHDGAVENLQLFNIAIVLLEG